MWTIRTPKHRALVALIKAERQKAGLRQIDVAKKLGQSQSWIVRLEGGQRRIDVVEFLLIAKVVGFDPVEAIRHISRMR